MSSRRFNFERYARSFSFITNPYERALLIICLRTSWSRMHRYDKQEDNALQTTIKHINT
jgi:hypothetical protein